MDLHGLTPEAAFRKLSRELHAARVRRDAELLVITGRGFGNAAQVPILRGQVERFLRSDDGARAGVLGFTTTSRGGALLVSLRANSARRARADEDPEEGADED